MSPSLTEQPPEDSPTVLERLLHPFRPSFKRRYTANQLSTLNKSTATSTSSLASSSRARSRRSNSSPSRPPSVRSSAGGRRSAGASSPALVATSAGSTSAAAGTSSNNNSNGNIATVPSSSIMAAQRGPSPRSSVDDSVDSRYSPSASFSYDNHSVSDHGARQTPRQGPSPLASPHHSQPHLARDASSPNLLSPPQGSSSSSSRPKIGRRQSSRLATALSRPFFRRSSSQKNEIAKAATSSKIQPSGSNLAASATASTSPAATESSGSSSGGYISQQRPTTASTASGPPSPAAGGRRQFTVSSSTTRSASSSHVGTATTPLAAVDTSHHAFPSPFFAQSTPTTSHISNPFAPPIDCIPVLTTALAQPITSTLLQLVPLSLTSPYAPSTSLCTPHALGSLPSASTVSIASSSISETPTASSYHPSSASASGSSSPTSSALVSNEQLAASSLSIPTTALAAVWRQVKASEWVAQHGTALNALIHSRTNPMTPRAVTTPQNVGPLGSQTTTTSPLSATATAGPDQDSAPTLPVFDFSAMLQSVLDCLAPTSAEKNVDIVYFHGSRHQYYPKHRRPSSSGNGSSQDDNQEVQEAFVRADEKGLGVAILVMLRQIMGDLSAGTTLEVGLSVALTIPPAKQANDRENQDLSNLEPDSDDEDEEVDSRLGTYMLTIELTTSRSSSHPTSSSQPSATAPESDSNTPQQPGTSLKIDPIICSALFQYLHLSFMTLPKKDDHQEYKITCVLPQARPPGRGNPNFDPTSRRRKSIDQSRQPSVSDFARDPMLA